MNRSFFLLIRLLVLPVVLFALSGCGSAPSPVTYHSLLDSRPAGPSATQNRLAILVGPVSIPDILKSAQIATGGDGGRFRLSDSHRWAGEVDGEVARALGELLARRLGTEQVAIYPRSHHLTATHQVLVDILALEGNLGAEARLAVRWSVVDPHSKTVRINRRSDFAEQPTDSSYDAWIAAQRRNLDRLSEAIAMAIASSR